MRRHLLASGLMGLGLVGTLAVYGVRAEDPNLPRQPVDTLQELEDAGKLLFKLADTNNDNLISQKEAVDTGNLLAGGFFFRADTNGDGIVTREEADAARQDMLNQRPVLRFVLQREQQVTAQEGAQNVVNQARQNFMNVVDANRDGNIQAAELRQGVQTAVQSLFMTSDKNADGQLEPSEVNDGIREIGRTAIQTAFNGVDTDRNGAISKAEFDKAIITPAHVLFGIMDANNDSQISRDELRSGIQILAHELNSLRVPEPSNSLSNQLREPGVTTAPSGSSAAPARTAAPVVRPTPGTVPQR